MASDTKATPREKMRFSLARLLVVTHTLLVVIWFAFIFYCMRYLESTEAPMASWLFMMIDFPLGYLVALITSPLWDYSPSELSVFRFVIVPGLIFMVTGGIQYYLIGHYIDKFRSYRYRQM